MCISCYTSRMITTIISDFSRVLLFPTDNSYSGSLNDLHKKLTKQSGDDYDFFEHFQMNEELFALYKNLNGKYPIYLFTTDTIQERAEVRELLDVVVADIFVAHHHNLKKNQADAYLFIANKLQKMPQTFLYIDDREENVKAAQEAGMSAIQYKNNKQLQEALAGLNIS